MRPSEPSVELGAQPRSAKSADVQAAIRDATKELRARVDALEAELKKSQKEISTAQKEKSEISGKLQETNAELEKAKSELAKTSKAEKEVRDQLLAAQESLQVIQSSGTGDQKAALALQSEIAQLKKALEAAEAGRSAAEKESTDANQKLLDARKQVASVTQERDTMQRERDDALRHLKTAGDAQARVQVLVAENSDLQKKLAAAENTVREISADRPKKAQELQDVKQQLEKLRDQLVPARKPNQDSEKMIADLRAQLDEASGAARDRETERRDPRRDRAAGEGKPDAARDRGAGTTGRSAARTGQEVDAGRVRQTEDQIRRPRSADPFAGRTDHEVERGRTGPAQSAGRGDFRHGARDDQSQPNDGETAAPITISNAPNPAGTSNPDEKSSLDSVAKGEGNTIGPEVGATFKPGVPADLLPLAREAKASFDQGKFKQAEKQYQEILTKSPNNLYSLSNLGVVLFRNGKLKAAELTLKKAIAIAPTDEFTHTTLGIVYYQQSKFDDALSELTKSLAINPKSATAHNYLGITASQKGWQEAAEKEMLEAIAENPEYADAHFNLAVVYSTSQPPAKELARRHYERALALGAEADPTLDKLLR